MTAPTLPPGEPVPPAAPAPEDRLPASGPLVGLPTQPEGTPWPGAEWPTGSVPAGVDLDPLLDAAFTDEDRLGTTYAVTVVHRGRLVAERWGSSLPGWDAPGEPVERDTLLLSWSMAKSFLHAVVGTLLADGRLELDAPAPVPEWRSPDDARRSITLEQLLAMRDGLAWQEDYVEAHGSDVIEMLFGDGRDDVAAFATARPPLAPPDTRFNYSSGTTNIVAGIVARELGPGAPFEAYVRERILDPIGMHPPRLTLDAAGTWIASSYLYARARDFARFGLLYLRDGVWDGRRLLPEGWVDHARRPRSINAEDGWRYGSHWWVSDDDLGTFWAHGYEGQMITVCPALDLVVVRLGRTPAELGDNLLAWRRSVIDAFRTATS